MQCDRVNNFVTRYSASLFGNDSIRRIEHKKLQGSIFSLLFSRSMPKIDQRFFLVVDQLDISQDDITPRAPRLKPFAAMHQQHFRLLNRCRKVIEQLVDLAVD
jgi:hypothetical protein